MVTAEPKGAFFKEQAVQVVALDLADFNRRLCDVGLSAVGKR
jgi:hypothetical protein